MPGYVYARIRECSHARVAKMVGNTRLIICMYEVGMPLDNKNHPEMKTSGKYSSKKCSNKSD
jgi:hypothetical protein